MLSATLIRSRLREADPQNGRQASHDELELTAEIAGARIAHWIESTRIAYESPSLRPG